MRDVEGDARAETNAMTESDEGRSNVYQCAASCRRAKVFVVCALSRGLDSHVVLLSPIYLSPPVGGCRYTLLHDRVTRRSETGSCVSFRCDSNCQFVRRYEEVCCPSIFRGVATPYRVLSKNSKIKDIREWEIYIYIYISLESLYRHLDILCIYL